MRGFLAAAAALLFVSACGVQIGGGRQESSAPDAAPSQSDAPSIDAGNNNTPDSGMTTPFAACMAKGYTAAGTLASLYRASANDKSWLDAQAECAADVPGATHLVVLSSAAESDFIKTKLGWVGLSDRATEGTFVNVTNEPNDYRPWIPGQPDNGSGNENCVQMKTGGLDDDQCGNAHDFVCECDGRPSVP
jgi:hypothetical protein